MARRGWDSKEIVLVGTESEWHWRRVKRPSPHDHLCCALALSGKIKYRETMLQTFMEIIRAIEEAQGSVRRVFASYDVDQNRCLSQPEPGSMSAHMWSSN